MTRYTVFRTFLILSLTFYVSCQSTNTSNVTDFVNTVNTTKLFYSTESVNSTQTAQTTKQINSTELVNTTNFGQYLGYCNDYCFGANQLCVDNQCQCISNYIWDNTTQNCQPFQCNNSTECQTYDPNRYCNYGVCSCNDNTKADPNNGDKCTRKTCSSSIYCPDICVSGFCYCGAGKRINDEIGKCEKFNCTSSEQCQNFDQNKFCDQTDGSCKCKDTFEFDIYNDLKCKRQECYGRSDFCLGKNQSCFGSSCYCDEDFFLSDVTGKCELNSCENSADCQLKDESSFCSGGLCKCNSNSIRVSQTDGRCAVRQCENDISCPDPHGFCVDGRCECEPNYRLSNISGRCEQYRCEDTFECQAYDPNRQCVNGYCICDDQMYFPDRRNGLKCMVQSCQIQSDCTTDHTVCLDQKCRCAGNYVYNTTSEKCQHFECLNSTQCQTFDANRVCNFGQCQCNTGFKANDTNGGKCVESSTTYDSYCSADSLCDSGQGRETCVNNRCRCAPNYRYNSELLVCEPFDCLFTAECNGYDPNRMCSIGNCICGYNYVEDKQNGGLCRQKSNTYEKYCTSNGNCYETNQRCVDNQCRCKPDYNWNANTQTCEYFRCVGGYNCYQSYDLHRHCDIYGSGCVCDAFYDADEQNGGKCTLTPITFSPIVVDTNTYKPYDYTWTYVTVPIIFILSCVLGMLRLTRVMSRPTRPVTTVRPNA